MLVTDKFLLRPPIMVRANFQLHFPHRCTRAQQNRLNPPLAVALEEHRRDDQHQFWAPGTASLEPCQSRPRWSIPSYPFSAGAQSTLQRRQPWRSSGHPQITSRGRYLQAYYVAHESG
jgi:hypothetical protein